MCQAPLYGDYMWMSHSVDPKTGYIVRATPDEVLEDMISHETLPVDQGEQRAKVEWCSPCGHCFEKEGLRAWQKACLYSGNPITCPKCREVTTGVYGCGCTELQAKYLQAQHMRDKAEEALRKPSAC